MNYQRLLIALIFFIQADLLALGQKFCHNNGNYTSNSTYSVNLKTALSSLSTNVDNSGFYNTSFGEGKDRANALVLCRGDLQLNECRGYIEKATAELLQTCPNQKQAIFMDELCMLRYSNATMIYGAMETFPKYYLWNTENATSADRFQEDLRNLLDDLRGKAAGGGPLRKVAAGNITAPDSQPIFALVQCTPDLSPEDCSGCLSRSASEIPLCCDRKIGGRVLIPSCHLRFEIYRFFDVTGLLEPDPASVPPPVPVIAQTPSIQSPSGKDNGITTPTIIIIVVSIVVCLIVAVLAIILLRNRQKQKLVENHQTNDEISNVESLQYDFGTIRVATNNFDDAKKLGQGGFGAVYRGILLNGKEIAVKRLAKDSRQGNIEFKNEVLLVAKLQHRNLVRFFGFALEGTERLLIYEFVPNASLDQFIFDPVKRSYLDWDKRYKIIKGIARGLMYLHEDSRLKIIHRDLKASNVLLDEHMNPKIADFGMARLFGQDETHGNTNRIVGTYGYMSPEYAMHGQFSVKSDVFSFGVLVLEILSGQRNNYFQNGEDLLTFIWKNWRDGTASNTIDDVLLRSSGQGEMLRCIHMGLLCVQENASIRPTMTSIVLMLNSSTVTLPVPSEPTFYVASRFGPHETNSRDKPNGSSRNEMSSHCIISQVMNCHPSYTLETMQIACIEI